ncbi:LPXTG cell wall anchor domain-containing protein [Corynebacterium diphtheriae]|nr:LPXTG cell wall anchor domain-containing protein [Corynebacterium diphtheriae]
MNKFSRTARSVTFAAIVGLSLGVSAPGMVAQAEGVWVNQHKSLIDAEKDGHATLTINKKYETDDNKINETPPTGEEDPGATGAANPNLPEDARVKEAKFKITLVQRLKTNEDIVKASKLTVASAKQARPLEDAKELTASGGTAKFENLTLGVYLVEEIEAPDGYAPASPFLAYVPMTKKNAADDPKVAGDAGQGSEWNYDVVAYPKNYKTKVEKKVEDTNKNKGEEITYTITGTVTPPALSEIQDPNADIEGQDTRIKHGNSYYKPFRRYIITDQIDAKHLDVQKDGVSLQDTFTEDDYTVDISPEKLIRVTLTESGLRKLAEEKLKDSTFQPQLTVKAKVLADGAKVENDATQIVNNGNDKSDSGDVKTKSNKVRSFWAKVKIVKESSEGNKKLGGAKFELYKSADAICSKDDLTFANRVKIDDKTEWTTDDESGEVTINGLHVNNVDDNSNRDAASGEQVEAYCLKETVAPKGYELLAEPIQLQLNVAEGELGIEQKQKLQSGVEFKAQEFELTATVKNVPDNTPNLPMTGGAGVGILAAIGAAIIGAGAWFARRNSAES